MSREAIAEAVARYAEGTNAEELTTQALARLAYRRRHSGKHCPSCQQDRPISAFGRDSRERDGLNRICKTCRNSYERERVNANLS